MLIENGVSNEIYNVCSGKSVSVGDIVNILKSLAKKEIQTVDKILKNLIEIQCLSHRLQLNS